MNPQDQAYIDAYKRLNDLCALVLSSSNGVPEYLLRMRNEPLGEYLVYTWDDDYRALRYFRKIRRRIDRNKTDIPVSKRDAVIGLNNFFLKIRTGRDPLALLRITLANIDSHRVKQAAILAGVDLGPDPATDDVSETVEAAPSDEIPGEIAGEAVEIASEEIPEEEVSSEEKEEKNP